MTREDGRNPRLAGASGQETAELARFAAGLRRDALPEAVARRLVELFVDWASSAFSGRGHRAIGIVEDYARAMGPEGGPSAVLTDRRRTSPHFAALVNAGASHISEQDDVHNGSVVHPGAVVFPAALALAEARGASGAAFLAAAAAGYETGIRVGEFLGRSHYETHHTTGTAGTLAAAAAGSLLGLDAEAMGHAFGSAGTRSAGLWEFLRDAAGSKQLHTAGAAADGLMAAWIAGRGFTGARRILEGERGLAMGTSRDADPARLTDGLGTRWCVAETSFKFHASCRHTHPSANALLAVVEAHDLAPGDVARVTAGVARGAHDVLAPVTDPRTVHEAKFSRRCQLNGLWASGMLIAGAFRPRGPRPAAMRRTLRGGGGGWRGRSGDERAGRRGCAPRRRPRRSAAALLASGTLASASRASGRGRGCSRRGCSALCGRGARGWARPRAWLHRTRAACRSRSAAAASLAS